MSPGVDQFGMNSEYALLLEVLFEKPDSFKLRHIRSGSSYCL